MVVWVVVELLLLLLLLLLCRWVKLHSLMSCSRC